MAVASSAWKILWRQCDPAAESRPIHFPIPKISCEKTLLLSHRPSNMRTRQLDLLQKTMVVSRAWRLFDPKLDIWKFADPVVREWMSAPRPVGRIQAHVRPAGWVACCPACRHRAARRCGAGAVRGNQTRDS